MGKLPSNLLGGNFKWMGNIDECEKVEAVVNGTTFFHGKYCYARIRLNMLPDAFKVSELGCSDFYDTSTSVQLEYALVYRRKKIQVYW